MKPALAPKFVTVPDELKERMPASSCEVETFCSVLGKYKNLCDQVDECVTEVRQARCAWVDTSLGNGTDWCKFQINEKGCIAVGPYQGCAWKPARNYCVPKN
jgi:hypothetical protein